VKIKALVKFEKIFARCLVFMLDYEASLIAVRQTRQGKC
jgi:hypothetical protein